MANLEEKIGEAIVEVGKETVSDLVRPTSKSIGKSSVANESREGK